MVATAEIEEAPDYDSARALVLGALRENDLRWPSAELELFERDGRALILASPVKVYLPEFMVRLLP